MLITVGTTPFGDELAISEMLKYNLYETRINKCGQLLIGGRITYVYEPNHYIIAIPDAPSRFDAVILEVANAHIAQHSIPSIANSTYNSIYLIFSQQDMAVQHSLT